VNPPVDLMGERVRVIALESFEHLLQLTSRTFAGGPPHRLTSNLGYRADRIEPSVDAGYQIDCSLSRGTSTRSSHASMVHARPGSGSAVGLIRHRQKHACRVQSRHDCNPTGRTVVGHAAQWLGDWESQPHSVNSRKRHENWHLRSMRLFAESWCHICWIQAAAQQFERARRSFRIVKAQFISQRGAAVPAQRKS